MHIKKFVKLIEFANSCKIDAGDLIILYDVGVSSGEEGTIMKIIKKPSSFSRSMRHARVKKMCSAGYLVKKEVPNNMRKKTLELSDKAMEFLKSFERVGDEEI